MIYFLIVSYLILDLNAIQPQGPNLNVSIGPITITQSKKPLNRVEYVLYKNRTLSDFFNIKFSSEFSCTPPIVKSFVASTYNQTSNTAQYFTIPIIITNDALNQSYSVRANVSNFYKNKINSSVEYIQGQNYDNILPSNSVKFNIVHKCSARINNFNYWSIINVNLVLGKSVIKFQYQMICDPNYESIRFDWSYFILVAVYSIIVLLMANYGKIKSFRVLVKPTYSTFDDKKNNKLEFFQGFYVNYIYSVFYLALIAISLLYRIETNSAKNSFDIIAVVIISIILSFHYFDELICAQQSKILQQSAIKLIRYCDILSLILTGGLFATYFLLDRAWFIGDLICAFTLGSTLKLFKIISLKDAVQFFCPCIIADIITTLTLRSLKHNWDILMLMDSNNPLLAEIPYFHYIYQKRCAWISVYSLILPGLFIAYTSRYGRNKQTYVYTIISFIGLFLGLLSWMFTSFSTGMTPIPMTLFTLIPMVAPCAIAAYKRGEIQTFWSGVFYDEILLDPFKNDTNNTNVDIEMKVEEVKNNPNGSSFLVTRESGTFVVDQTLFQGIAHDCPSNKEKII